ncbi:uncharacterized protein J3D65DRAFT_555528 [Phyllosticta citribraziliensis]|uniref:Nitrogen regulatory protein areA GATA-like domain-containing protein n=1 Tax=Phyllosticta citribraziliensis TaxID=989973 RepID=A0ABR1LLD7_9PEZI
MPFKSQVPILQVESAAIHTVDTRSPEQLFGLWSIFAKCSDSLDEGKRLENLSWRLWNRETFCCAPDHPTPSPSLFDTPSWSFTRKGSDSGSMSVPALSSSLESDVSDDRVNSIATLQTTSSARPQIRRLDSTESRNRGTEKHITPIDLESLVISIKEKKELEPLSPLPMPPPVQQMPSLCEKEEPRAEDTTPRSTAQPQMVPESSTSTVATAVDSDLSKLSPPVVGSDTSTSTDCSSHSVVRGFSPGRVSSSYRSKTNLQPHPQPIPTLKVAPQNTQPAPVQKKKGAMFTLGGSSDEGGDSSLETHMQMAQIRTNARSSLSDGLRKPIARKQPSFEQMTSSRALAKAYENEDVFESDSDEEVSESAIEDDDEDQWEDSETDSGPASVEEKVSFQRVDSKPNLTSRRSLLTTLMHEGDRAQALQNAASQSTPALRRSKNTSPNGPSIAASPTTNTLRYEPAPETNNNNNNNNNNIPRSKPIIMTTSNTHAAQPALSPRTTRRNMLTTELTESLRKHLLWERQQKNSTNNAVLKRRHTSTDVKNLKHYPGEPQPAPLPTLKENPAAKGNNSWTTNYFDSGLQEYHERGW